MKTKRIIATLLLASAAACAAAEANGFRTVKDIPYYPDDILSQADVLKKDSFFCVVGQIVNTAADERILDENGKVDVTKLNALIYDTFRHGYYVCGEKVGQAFKEGAALAKK